MTLKPAWYSTKGSGRISDFLDLLHPPYTLWHLSYVLLGIGMAPLIFPSRSIAVVVAFFLGLGVGAHALDETMGNPLQTKISRSGLYLLGFSSIGVASAIGAYYVVTLSLLLIPFVALECFFAIAYNLEAFKKRFHNTLIFALSWGSIPFLTGYFVNALTFNLPVFLMALGVALLTFVQRTLSTQARLMRRKMPPIEALKLSTGTDIPVTTAELISPAEKSLKALTAMIFVISIAVILARL
jgi:hypothetical protein